MVFPFKLLRALFVLSVISVGSMAALTVEAQISRPANDVGIGTVDNNTPNPAPAPGPVTPTPGPVNPDPVTPTPGPVNPDPVTPNPGPVTPPPNPGPVTPPPVPGPVTPPPVPGPVTPPVKVLSYFVIINGQQAGPFDEAGLKARAAAGDLVRTSLVWTAGMTDWDEAGKVPDLAQIISSVPPKPKFDAMGFLAGTWQADPQQMQVPNIGMGTIQGTTTYGRDGSMQSYATLDVMVQGYPMRQIITATGTYTATEQAPGKILVTPNTTATFSVAGQPSNTQQLTTPFVVTVVDQNTAMSDEGVRSYRISN